SALARPAPGRAAHDESSVIRAVTQGITAGGRALDAAMPRYALTLEDGAALLAFLRGLDAAQAAGLGADTVRIGLVLPPGAGGEAFAASLAAAIAGAAPEGVHRRRILLDHATAAGPGDAARAAAELLARPVFAIVSALPAEAGGRAVEAAARTARAPLLATRAASAEAGPMAFALLPGTVQEGLALLGLGHDPARILLLAPGAGAEGAAQAIAARSIEAEPRIVAPAGLAAALPGASAVLLPDGAAGLDADAVARLRLSGLPVLLPGPSGALAAPVLAAALGRPVTVAIGIPPAVMAGGGAPAARFRAGPGAAAGLPGRLGHASGEVLVEALRRAGRGLTRERLADALAAEPAFETGSLPSLALTGGARAAPGRVWVLRIDGAGRIHAAAGEAGP
ncbi:hypothetical protein, partial [Falsiroseomonas sp. CW058]|uniref:hypothetical protein n=1 Tax=Falsiroseomonas sp. CW058 TaxID=3388664 RepID=UPI003D31B63A